MTDHDMLIELLAIKLYEHDGPGPGGTSIKPWMAIENDADRQIYRTIVIQADRAQDLYRD